MAINRAENRRILEELHELQGDSYLYQSPKDIYYTRKEIRLFNMNEAIELHPLAKEKPLLRSKLAYKDLLTYLSPTRKYCLPGLIVCFEYTEPKLKEELEYYDRTPLVVFCGITKTKDGNIREIGVNLHYFPPFTRQKVINTTYNIFKDYYGLEQTFNNGSDKPNMFISYDALKGLMKRSKIGFGIKMYIPSLRRRTYIIPTKMLSTAFYTEGNFSKKTRSIVFQYWRHFRW